MTCSIKFCSVYKKSRAKKEMNYTSNKGEAFWKQFCIIMSLLCWNCLVVFIKTAIMNVSSAFSLSFSHHSRTASVHILEQSRVERWRVQVLHLHRYTCYTHIIDTHQGIVWGWATDVKPALAACVCFPHDDKCNQFRVLHAVSATLTAWITTTPPPQCPPRRV